jgi:hypothetical protein
VTDGNPETPPADAVPFNEPVQVKLAPGEKATVTFEPQTSGTRFHLPTVGISKLPNSTYEVRADDTPTFGQAPVPPTDVDDFTETFRPPVEFSDSLTVVVRNVDNSTTRTYTIQPVGWEV